MSNSNCIAVADKTFIQEAVKVKNEGEQTLPEFLQMFTVEELRTMCSYRHSVDKTSYETFLVKGPIAFYERMIPSRLSANSVSILGQLSVVLAVAIIFHQAGFHISPDYPLSSNLLVMGGLSFQVFSMTDLADGVRARRLKCGSPLGRLVDEGGDVIVISCQMIILAHAFNYNHWLLDSMWVIEIMLVYGMELKLTVCQTLDMQLGEIGPIEFDLFLTLIIMVVGYYGPDTIQETIGQKYEIPEGSWAQLLAPYRLSHIIGAIFFALFLVFMDDGLGESMRKDWKKALLFYLPCLASYGSYFALTTLPSYQAQKAVVILLVNFINANQTLNLMLHNMMDREFKILQPSLFMITIPLIAYHIFEVSAATELLITRLCVLAVLLRFVWKMATLSKQWCDFAQSPFFILPVKDKQS